MSAAAFSSDMLICVVLNHSKDALLLLNHQTSSAVATTSATSLTSSSCLPTNLGGLGGGAGAADKDSYDSFKQYWFPFKPVASLDQSLSTQRQIENYITVSLSMF